jgi:hypothetical protein
MTPNSLASARSSPISLIRPFLLMTDHGMFLEYDWTSNTYRSHLCGASSEDRALFPDAGGLAPRISPYRSLRVGDKIDERTWRIEFFMEPVAERADAFHLRDSPIGMGNEEFQGVLSGPTPLRATFFGVSDRKKDARSAREHSAAAIIMVITQCNGPKMYRGRYDVLADKRLITLFVDRQCYFCLEWQPMTEIRFPRAITRFSRRIVMGPNADRRREVFGGSGANGGV